MFICINFVLGLIKSQLYATQQAEKVGFMTVSVQAINLVGIFALSLFSNGSLVGVAIIAGLSGIIVNLFYTGNVWKKFSYLVPKLNYFRKNELQEICNIGVKFFFLQIAALVLYSTDNIIITRLFGPTYVTPYSTVYTVFGVVYGLFSAMISPLWSRYTYALEKKDFIWIKRTIINLDKVLPLIGFLLFIGILLFKPVCKIWLHRELNFETGLITCMAIYYLLLIWSAIYATALNGMGRINLQLVLGVGTAILNIPLSIWLGNTCGLGTTGVCCATVICMLITNIP